MGNAQRALTALNTGSEERTPSVSRDGSMIVWSSDRPGGAAATNFEIYFANTDGTNLRQYTSDSGDFPPSDTAPVISPDQTKIAWTTTRGGNPNVAVMNIDGTNQITLTPGNPGEDSQPAWSSDSQTLAFFSSRGNAQGIYLMNSDGSNQRPLLTSVNGSTTTFGNPAFSPDGRYLAITVQTPGGTQISLRNADGTPAATTFNPPGALSVRTNASFSLDSTRLVYTGSNGAGSEQVFSANLDGSDERALTMQGQNLEPMFGG